MGFKQTVLGSACIGIASFLFATHDALYKLSNIHESQLLISQCIIQLIIASIWWIIKKPSNNGLSLKWYGDNPYFINIWLRGLIYVIYIIFFYYAIIRLPLGDAMCIIFQAPLLISIIARIFLKLFVSNLFRAVNRADLNLIVKLFQQFVEVLKGVK